MKAPLMLLTNRSIGMPVFLHWYEPFAKLIDFLLLYRLLSLTENLQWRVNALQRLPLYQFTVHLQLSTHHGWQGFFVYEDAKEVSLIYFCYNFWISSVQTIAINLFWLLPTDSWWHSALSGFSFDGPFQCCVSKEDWLAQHDFPRHDSTYEMAGLVYLEWW